jgi:hypothetical protein
MEQKTLKYLLVLPVKLKITSLPWSTNFFKIGQFVEMLKWGEASERLHAHRHTQAHRDTSAHTHTHTHTHNIVVS